MKDSSFLKKRSKKLLPVGILLILTGCAEDPPVAPPVYTQLKYDYLPKLRLNVGNIDVQDHSLPVGPQDVASSSPAVPAQVLAQMAHDRFFAAGLSGAADFSIDQASIVREPNGTLDGHLAIHLDILSAPGVRTGFAEAQVARQHVPGTDPEDPNFALYTLTRQMMADMNVELEYQLKRSLGAYLVTPGSAPAPVIAQPLATPGILPPVPPPPALPPADPSDQAQTAPPPRQMSPPPGFLQIPPQ